MKGPLRRFRPARAGEDGETSVMPATSPEPVSEDAAAPGAATTDSQPPLPAGVAPEELIGGRPSTRRRGRLRRRLRHLRQVRELMLRDVGGLVYEFHRAGAGSAPGEPGAALVGRKLERLVALDTERRELEELLDDRRAETVLREPGVGGTCSDCGELLASDARFCASCGAPVDGRKREVAAASGDATPAEATGA